MYYMMYISYSLYYLYLYSIRTKRCIYYWSLQRSSAHVRSLSALPLSEVPKPATFTYISTYVYIYIYI